MGAFGRRSNLKNYLIEGIPEMEAMLKDLTDETLNRVVTETLEEIGRPTQIALANYYANKGGKHDGETLTRAMQHRWWSKRKKRGLPTGFSRAQIARTLLTEGFGFTVRKFRKSDGFLLRIKAWGPAVHLLEKGRYKGVNTYRGWGTGLGIMRRFANTAIQKLNTVLPQRLEAAAAEAARRAGSA